MRIAVISDTHGEKNALKRALDRIGAVDALVHLGDGGLDLGDAASGIGAIYAVHGNSDPSRDLPEELLLSFCGHTLFLCHGHRYGVKQGLQRLYYRGVELGADIVLFGHTHQAFQSQEADLLILNPGSVGRPYPGRRSSVAIMDLKPGVCNAQIIEI